ncbi:MAG: hypothetical protein A3A04_02150 [Candidatus Harrisonbacteria bacterium RIFCSPLOWO2_01_FULL_40_28]|uniref:NERD domain-containing protein n=1 Tax=Candidatus Harrisonbacteria bacterium RIFCSPLOWO2_01_FULL_40_28 TaxID=1798406 RepID=A0A1G1ZL14_9BACT|nr:MAG: hypothetical protein A3A04_02150 [Candidatus Harrisonbacteria bacterium RIFCSPLOWO2_01_FULL_40_28]
MTVIYINVKCTLWRFVSYNKSKHLLKTKKTVLRGVLVVNVRRMDDQGQEAESKVERALFFLKEHKFISRYINAKKNGELDNEGIDYLIILKTGMACLLQVKSSRSSLSRHKKKYPDTPYIIVEPRDCSIKLIEKRIVGIIRKALRTTFISCR